MTNTKWLSALLAGTALTVASTAAMADSSFLTMSRNVAGQGVTFSVAPTADMPAAASSVMISGVVSAHAESIDNDTSINTESDIYFSASTDTAIGKVTVGANANLESATWSSYVGSLEFAPGVTLFGGNTEIYKADAYSAKGTTSMYSVGDDASSRDQIGVSYVSGPLTMGVMAYEAGTDNNALGAMVAGSFGGASVKAVVNADEEEDVLAGVQVNFAVDMFSFGIAGNVGEGDPADDSGYRDTDVDSGEDWSSLTATASVSPAEAWTLAASYGWEKNKDQGVNGETATGYTLSATWSPVAQYDVVVAYNKNSNVQNSKPAGEEVFGVGMWFKF